MPSAWNIDFVHWCHRFLMFVKKNKLEPQLNQNDGTDRNLWKSLSAPAGIALESRFNNTCVLPKRCDVANARQFVEKSERLERARVVGKKDGLWQESSITKGKMRIKSHAGAGFTVASLVQKVMRGVELCLVAVWNWTPGEDLTPDPSPGAVWQADFFFPTGFIRDAGLCNAPSKWMNN